MTAPLLRVEILRWLFVQSSKFQEKRKGRLRNRLWDTRQSHGQGEMPGFFVHRCRMEPHSGKADSISVPEGETRQVRSSRQFHQIVSMSRSCVEKLRGKKLLFSHRTQKRVSLGGHFPPLGLMTSLSWTKRSEPPLIETATVRWPVAIQCCCGAYVAIQ